MFYKDFIITEKQDPIRERLVKCMRSVQVPRTFDQFATEMKIASNTLRRFLEGNNAKFFVRCKIENWCDKVDKKEI